MYYYGARYFDPRTSIWLSVDGEFENGPNVSPYVYCFNNPITLTDPDGNWPTLPSWNDVKKSASQAYNRTKAYASQKYNEAKNYTTQKYNEAKAYASKKYSETKTAATKAYNDTKKTIIDAKNNAVATTKKTINDGQQWVKNNKEDILAFAKGTQDFGDAVTVTGGVIAVGTAVTGVGVGVGGTVAAWGEGIGLFGKGIEVLTLAIAGDYSDAANATGEKAAWMGAGKVADVLIDRAIPGPTPDFTPVIDDVIGNDVLKNTTKAKLTVIEGAVSSDKNKNK